MNELEMEAFAEKAREIRVADRDELTPLEEL